MGNTYKDNEDGVSAAIAFTSKGDEVLHQCNCTLVEHPFEVVAEGQMKKNPEDNKNSRKIKDVLDNGSTTIYDVENKLGQLKMFDLWKNRLKHPVRSIRNLIRK